MQAREQVNTEFGKRLRERRRAMSIARWQLSAESGLSPDTIGRYERGEGGPSIGDALKIASALGCRVTDLLPDLPEEETA